VIVEFDIHGLYLLPLKFSEHFNTLILKLIKKVIVHMHKRGPDTDTADISVLGINPTVYND